MRYLHLTNGKTIDFVRVAELAEQGYSLVRAAAVLQINEITLAKHLKLNNCELHAQMKKNGIDQKKKIMRRVNQSHFKGKL